MNISCDHPVLPNGRRVGAGEVALTQYLRPDARTKVLAADVGEDLAMRAKARRFILTAEVIPSTCAVVMYGRRFDQDPEREPESTEVAHNGPGDNKPVDALKRLLVSLLEASS